MEEDHDDDHEPSDFLKKNRDLLKGFSFKFEGLPPHLEKEFKRAVQDLGASVSDDAKYILTEKSYLALDVNKHRSDLYNICYILDSITAKRSLDIELYRHKQENNFSEYIKSPKKNDVVNVSIASNDVITEKSNNICISKKSCTNANNLEKRLNHVSQKVPAEVQESDELMDVEIDKNESDIDAEEEEFDSSIINNEKNYKQSSKINMQQEIRHKINSNITNKTDDEIAKSNKVPNPLAKANKKLTSQTTYSKTVESGNKVINQKKINILEDVYWRKENEINENVIDNAKTSSFRKKTSLTQLSIEEKHKSIDKIKIEPTSDDESSVDNTQDSKNHSQINRKLNKGRNKYAKEDFDSSQSTDDELTDNLTRPSTSQNIQNSNGKGLKKKVSGWIDPKSVSNLSQKVASNIAKNEILDSSDSDVIYDSDEENKKLNFRKYWWMEQDIPDNEVCKKDKCTFEPFHHRSHEYPGHFLSDDEKKIILKYLITNKCIHNAKGAKVWINMLDDGYLTHRSAETLRNCFRRSILSNITSFGLPTDILDKFLELEDKKRTI